MLPINSTHNPFLITPRISLLQLHYWKLNMIRPNFDRLTRYFVAVPLTLTLITGLTACLANPSKNASSQNQTTQHATLPEWVKSPPGDDTDNMYGIGEGYSLDGAKQSALKDIAGKLATHIKSETENRTYLQNNHLDSTYKQRIKTQVKETKLTSYEVLKTAQQAGQYYVIISMSRAAFIKDKQNQLSQITSKIETVLENVEAKNKLIQLVRYNRSIQLSNQARPLIYLINAADPQANLQHYLDGYRQYEQKEKHLSENTRFFLTSNSEFTPLTTQIKKMLQTNGFQVTNRTSADSILEIQGTIAEQDIFSTKSVNINFNVLTKTKSGQLIGNEAYQLYGSSVSNFETSRQLAFGKLVKKLSNKHGIYQMLGLNKKK